MVLMLASMLSQTADCTTKVKTKAQRHKCIIHMFSLDMLLWLFEARLRARVIIFPNVD